MEYFHSEDHNPDFYGTMSNIPQVVIGTGGKTIEELGELWMSAFGLAELRRNSKQPSLSPESEEHQKSSAKEAKQKLADHRIQMLMLEEIKMQLTVFQKFALKMSKTAIAVKMMDVLDLISSILSTKEIPSTDDVFKNQEDFVFQSLTEALNDFDNL